MPPETIARHLNAREILDRRSCFLFGPRQTGKSTLIRQQFEGCPTYNLLDQALFVRLSRNPALIREALTPETTLVVIDEIQRMPTLLNEVQEHGVRFLLTGSMRRKAVNLRSRARGIRPSSGPTPGRDDVAAGTTPEDAADGRAPGSPLGEIGTASQ